MQILPFQSEPNSGYQNCPCLPSQRHNLANLFDWKFFHILLRTITNPIIPQFLYLRRYLMTRILIKLCSLEPHFEEVIKIKDPHYLQLFDFSLFRQEGVLSYLNLF